MNINYCPQCGEELRKYNQPSDINDPSLNHAEAEIIGKGVPFSKVELPDDFDIVDVLSIKTEDTLPGPDLDSIPEYSDDEPEYFYVVGQTVEFASKAYIITKVVNNERNLGWQKLELMEIGMDGNIKKDYDENIIWLHHNGDKQLKRLP